MGGYAFRPGIHHCFSGDYSIILDLKQDRYFALGDALHTTLRRLSTGTDDESDEANVTMLVSRAILVGSDAATRPLSLTRTPPARDYRMAGIDVRGAGAVRALSARIRVLAALRIMSLETILARAAARREQYLGHRGPCSIDAALEISAAFRATDLLLEPHSRCLPRSIAMLDMLASRGCRATLVMGVSSRPFMAHCWVEQSGVLLSDLTDNVRPYTPILVL